MIGLSQVGFENKRSAAVERLLSITRDVEKETFIRELLQSTLEDRLLPDPPKGFGFAESTLLAPEKEEALFQPNIALRAPPLIEITFDTEPEPSLKDLLERIHELQQDLVDLQSENSSMLRDSPRWTLQRTRRLQEYLKEKNTDPFWNHYLNL